MTGGDDGGWATVRVSLACRACTDTGTRLSPPHGGHGCFTAALCMCSTLVDAGRSTPPPRRMTRAAAAVGATGVDRSSVATRWAVRGGGWTLAPPAAAAASIFRPARAGGGGCQAAEADGLPAGAGRASWTPPPVDAIRVERALDDATVPRCGRPPSHAPRPPRSRRVGRTGSVPTWRQRNVVRVWVGRRPCARRGGVHGRDDGGRRWRLFWRQCGHAQAECLRRWGLVRAATLPRPRQRSPDKSKHCGCAAPRRHRLRLQATDDEANVVLIQLDASSLGRVVGVRAPTIFKL